MKRIFLALLYVLAATAWAYAQTLAPLQPTTQVTIIGAASGNVANATATATIAATVDKKNYLCGFSITSTGSTAAAVVSPTVTGLSGGTLTLSYATVAGATLSNQPLIVNFSLCIPASATNTAIAVALPALGAGNTNATVNAWGYRQ